MVKSREEEEEKEEEESNIGSQGCDATRGWQPKNQKIIEYYEICSKMRKKLIISNSKYVWAAIDCMKYDFILLKHIIWTSLPKFAITFGCSTEVVK